MVIDRARRRLFVWPLAALLATCLTTPGCDNDAPPDTYRRKIAIDKIPATVIASAKKAISDVTPDEAWENLQKDGKLHSYEIRGKNASTGKMREVRVSPTGEVLEQE